MICPKCSKNRLQAVHTANSGPIVKRVRRCRDCHTVTQTIELPIFNNILTKEDIAEYEEYIHKELNESKDQRSLFDR